MGPQKFTARLRTIFSGTRWWAPPACLRRGGSREGGVLDCDVIRRMSGRFAAYNDQARIALLSAFSSELSRPQWPQDHCSGRAADTQRGLASQLYRSVWGRL